MFGKSITRRPEPKATHLAPLPKLPWRAFALALFAVLGSVYALVRHYTRPPPEQAPTTREIPAPELESAPQEPARPR